MLPVLTRPLGCKKAILSGTSVTLISPRTSPKLSLFGVDIPFRPDDAGPDTAGLASTEDCLRTRSAHDFAIAGAAGVASAVASLVCDVDASMLSETATD